DRAMMMYGVPESLILNFWSLETLVKKVKHGFDFLLLQKGFVKEEKEKLLSDDEIIDMYY
ncbi:MAG: hypothetical protein P1P59_02020, partial [Treponemataceae bacterium]